MKYDLTGQKFGRLTVISRCTTPGKLTFWECQCDCGRQTTVTGTSLRNGRVKSCGCWHKEESALRAASQFTKHGKNQTRLYRIWKSMRTRCLNPHSKDYSNYGGRGIVPCSEWNNFEIFEKWAVSHGYQDGLTIDRINVNKGYSPENCRWISRSEQNNNKQNTVRYTVNGITKTVLEWSKESGISYGVLLSRAKNHCAESDFLVPTK